jgi:hypothetical protein
MMDEYTIRDLGKFTPMPIGIYCEECGEPYRAPDVGDAEDIRLRNAINNGLMNNDWSGRVCRDCNQGQGTRAR